VIDLANIGYGVNFGRQTHDFLTTLVDG
jgi:hypothetical protein